MKYLYIIILIISFSQTAVSDRIYVPPGGCITVPPGSVVCADTLFVDTNGCFIASNVNNVCQGMVVQGGGLIVIGVENISNEIPHEYKLYQNYPNPFNPATMFRFQMPVKGNVKIVIFDILGREVTTLVNEQLSPGTYETAWDATNFASGIYYYKLVAETFTETKKMVLIK